MDKHLNETSPPLFLRKSEHLIKNSEGSFMKVDSRPALQERRSSTRASENLSSSKLDMAARSSHNFSKRPTDSSMKFDEIVSTKVPSAGSLTAVMHDNSLALSKVLSKNSAIISKPSELPRVVYPRSQTRNTASTSQVPSVSDSEHQKMSDSPLIVKVPNAAKNRDVVEVFVETMRMLSETPVMVIRTHDDFTSLLEILKLQENLDGIVFPPLPLPPSGNVISLDVRAQKDIADKTGIFLGDYQENCVGYENFLNLCLLHPRLANLPVLRQFLLETDAPGVVLPSYSVLDKLNNVMEGYRISSYIERDEDFERITLLNTERLRLAKETIYLYEQLIHKERKLSKSYEIVRYYIQALNNLNDVPSSMKLWYRAMINGLEYASSLTTILTRNRQRTLGATLQLNEGFLLSQLDTLQKRTKKSVELMKYEKALGKAITYEKHQEIKESINRSKKEFEEISKLAKPEIARFHRQRTGTMKGSFTIFAHSEIKLARAGLAVFKKMYKDAWVSFSHG